MINLFLPFAQAIEVVQVEPAKARIIVSPGSAKTGSIKIYNNSPNSKSIKAYLEDWAYLPACDGSKDFHAQGSTPLSAGDWISFSPAEFTILPYARQMINYAVRIPEDAQGGHYAVLFFENYLGENKAAQEGVSVNVAIRVAALFYIEPQGTIKRQAKIDNLKVEKRQGAYYVSADFANTGNVDINTKGSFSVIDAKGMVYGRGEFNDVYTFPGDTAVLRSSWKESMPAAGYDLILTVDIGKGLEDTGTGRGPVITKEAHIDIDAAGNPTLGALE